MRRAVFIGRFQPFHLGHLHAIKEILESYDELIIVIGSAQYSHTVTNPFTTGERVEMIRRGLRSSGIDLAKIIIIPLPDIGEHALWVSRLTSFLPPFDAVFTNNKFVQLLLAERGLKYSEPKLADRETLNATYIRSLMIKGERWREFLQKDVADYIDSIDGARRLRIIAESDAKSERSPG
ncbi:MAG: nicotinamide-nucleotide adenylyltransferase [Aigarchaeota archaeon]|nr:nicotinamide-nucleotide adenylyltransferase [Aigarchaeota archaeon]MDW8092624.1 nicotinamide-nucleotide adenylyltransferase [Nitrososphaerota archaeon]